MTASVLAADVGRTTTRLRVVAPGPPVPDVAVPNGASLADRDGVAVVLASLLAASASAGVAGRAADVERVAVGASGAAQDREAAAALAAALAERFPAAAVCVTSDVVAAHVGALGGGPGVVVIAGTGAVALAVGAGGASHLVDGWGYLLGDAGSGAQVGRAGLAAALRHHDGRPGGSPALAAAAAVRFGPLDGLVATVQSSPTPVRDAAGFAPDVAAAARAGDQVARELWSAAAAELATTTRTAVAHLRPAVTTGDDAPIDVAFAGSLFDLDDLVATPVRAAVTATDPSVRFVPRHGDALAGAVRLATDGPGVHDPLLVRIPPGEPRGRSAAETLNFEEA